MWPSAWALAAGGDLVMTPEVEWRAAVGVGLPAAVAPDADASPFALHGPRGPRDLRTPGIDPPGLPHRRNSRGRRLRRVSLAGGRPPPPSCPHHYSEPASAPAPESASESDPESESNVRAPRPRPRPSHASVGRVHIRARVKSPPTVGLVCVHPRSALGSTRRDPGGGGATNRSRKNTGRVSGGGPAGGVTPAGEGLVTNPPKTRPEGGVLERRLAGGVTPARRGLVTDLSK
jgi:hypothetical protein